MSQYIAKPKMDWDADTPQLNGATIIDTREAVNTGTVDASGTPIYRLPEPIGFQLVRKSSP